MVATPVQQYGMFSGKSFVADPVIFYVVDLDGRRIDESALSQTERDLLQSYPQLYECQSVANASVYNVISNVFAHAGISTENWRHKFTNDIKDLQFANWYNNKLKDITGKSFTNMALYKQGVKWERGRFVATSKPLKLSFIAAE